MVLLILVLFLYFFFKFIVLKILVFILLKLKFIRKQKKIVHKFHLNKKKTKYFICFNLIKNILNKNRIQKSITLFKIYNFFSSFLQIKNYIKIQLRKSRLNIYLFDQKILIIIKLNKKDLFVTKLDFSLKIHCKFKIKKQSFFFNKNLI